MMLKPTQDFILVKPLDREHSQTLAVVTHEKHCRGEVIRVGPGKRDKRGVIQPLDTKPGDIVAFGNGSFDFYPKYQDTPEGQVYRLIQEADVAYIEDVTIEDVDRIHGEYRATGDEFHQAVLAGNSTPEMLADLERKHQEVMALAQRVDNTVGARPTRIEQSEESIS